MDFMDMGSVFRQFNKIFQQLQADSLAFLRVKLRRKNIVAPDGGRKGLAVFRARGDNAAIRRLRIETVHEIDITAVRHTAKQGTIGLCFLKPIPADLRNFQPKLVRKPDDTSLENAETGGTRIKFLAPLKQ